VTDREELVPVLVVDDERDIRDGVERFLKRMGCRVHQAADGAAGLEALAEHRPWVVLLDLKMPGMDGLEVLPVILREEPETLVIVITGYATVETAIQAMKNGAYDFIPKPFNPDQLRITVGRAIERRRLAEEARRAREERRRTLADLHTEKSRTRTIIRALPFGVLVTATDGRVALLNPALRHLLDLPDDCAPGRALEEYVDDAEFCRRARQPPEPPPAGAPPQEASWSCELATAGGRQLLARGTAVTGEEGESLGTVVVMVDLTPFKLLDGVKSEFVAKVSHELRSPLSTIYLQLSLLLDDGQSGQAESRHLISRAREKTEGLIAFVRDMLDLSRLESGAAREKQRVELGQTLSAVVEALEPQAREKEQSLSLELPEGGLPALWADPGALDSVFTNLVSNAVKYTPQGGSIAVRAAADGGRVRVEVADDGIGIEPDKKEAVFEKFYRVKSQHTRYVTGTGLGLPIVKSILEGMGGEVGLESQPGQGSTFTVLLPVEEPPAQP
jgi:signal transduction histidine kinase